MGLFSEGFISGGISLRFQMVWAWPIKTANSNSESMGLFLGGLIFGRAYYRKDICV